MPFEEFQELVSSTLGHRSSEERGQSELRLPNDPSMRATIEELGITSIRPLTRQDLEELERATMTRAPGWKARELLAFVYSKKTRVRVFEQLLADMQKEWAEAMMAGEERYAQWIRIRGYAALVRGAVAHAVALVGGKVRDIRRLI